MPEVLFWFALPAVWLLAFFKKKILPYHPASPVRSGESRNGDLHCNECCVLERAQSQHQLPCFEVAEEHGKLLGASQEAIFLSVYMLFEVLLLVVFFQKKRG